MVEKITRVPLRDVWAHEAVNFTPWLVDNLDFLNDALPFDLIEPEREKAAGTSWVDIVAKDADGGIAVIENQLGTSDHDHLGKVLTYLAAYGAKRAIWIVREAREEHIQAINWLNELGPVDFYLVRAEAVRIGEEIGAKFELITGPSDPLRTVGDTKRRLVSRQSQPLGRIIDECEFFANMPKNERKKVARITHYAVRMLWRRTGARLDAFAPSLPDAEFLDFIARHPRVLECVKHTHQVNGKANQLGPYLPLGYFAGLLYLMGSSTTDPVTYHESGSPNEEALDWKMWDRACDFFVMLAGAAQETAAIRDAMGKVIENDGGSIAERWALIVNAWNAYANDKPITLEALQLRYDTDEDGVTTLSETPIVGGIDVGKPDEAD